MAYNYSGFGKESGPSGPTKAAVSFGNFTRPPSLPFSNLAPSSSPRQPEVAEKTHSPPTIFGNYGPSVRPYQTARPRRAEDSQRVLSSPSAFENPRSSAASSYSPAGVHGLDDGQKSFFKYYDTQTHPRHVGGTSFVASCNSGTIGTSKIAQVQDLKRTRSPPLLSRNEEFSRNSNQATVPTPVLSSPLRDDRAKLIGNYPNLFAHQDQSKVSSYMGPYDSERSSMVQVPHVQGPKRTRSPPLPSANGASQENSQFYHNDSKRLGTRSNVFFSKPDSQVPQRSIPCADNTFAASTRPTSSLIPKRTRSPPLLPADEGLHGTLNAAQYDTEREMQAKAKRLARFRVELSENVQISPDVADQRVVTNSREHSVVEKQKHAGGHSMESSRDYPNDNSLSDYEGLETSSIIVGLCPDMCPESERAERGRKGDLDQYERLDGDRNQTSKYLAVKKYNRTAEREANLIRPMPILQKTVGYLLDLLDQPYDERFLGLYNFLWDRMRAIRMDLRMQHIFNEEAITMLEQMIRLHILAMHELCEYTKGEGFSEGFDAHLNIEQMNKTSVELFQMYDDHRKKGINVPTEKEFRGYYALLKLDKHPGYKVEPAELSLDLAKMTPEIRQTPEVLFARSVARACRTGNFIAFFRLARKASYLQACLMHAHFAKLRTQALASLHSGLQNNQGLPVAHVGKWLGMEEEDIEGLLEYHGFLIKDFEEPYMVKEGPFLNCDSNYPTKCSKLVHMKRSGKIVEDISVSGQIISLTTEAKPIQPANVYKHDTTAIPTAERKISIRAVDEEMPDSEATISVKSSTSVQPMVETSMVDQRSQDNQWVSTASISPWGLSVAHDSHKYESAKVVFEEKQNNDALFRMSPKTKMVFTTEVLPIENLSRTSVLDRSPSSKRYGNSVENRLPQIVPSNGLEDEEPFITRQEIENDEAMQSENDEVMENESYEVMAKYLEEEVALAKLKLILRLWRRRSSKLKRLRERRQLAANVALDSLSLGPPIQQNKDQPCTLGEFDVDHVMRERCKKHEQSWSKLNVSDVIASILGRRNPDAKCLCWKIVLSTQKDSLEGDKQKQSSQISQLAAEPWLLSKLMPPQKDYDHDDLVFSSSDLSIWKRWVPSQSGTDLTCCFSVIKGANFESINESVSGASAVLFLVSESIPLKLQKIKLRNLLMSIPSGSCLPLLILCTSYDEEVLDPVAVIVNGLGLHDIDKSRVNGFLVKFLVGNQKMGPSNGFFSDEQLREGLQWLASESPIQPVVHCVKTRELILTHLGSALEVLEKLSDYEVIPNHCISAFNEALDQSVGEILAAAKANPANWPCPEITLVKDAVDEHFVEKYLPSLAWSSAAKTGAFEFVLRDLKLPSFPDDLSWLKRGSNMGREIDYQILQLENCLIRYLTESSEIMGVPLATKEASVMLQRSTRLELRDLSYNIVPNWVVIFRRIFNWRLMSLNNGALSSAYVLEQHFPAPASDDLDKLGLEGSVSSPYCSSHLSLDEIMAVSCSPLLIRGAQSEPQAHQHFPVMAANGEFHQPANNILVENEINSSQNCKLTVADGAYSNSKLKHTDTEITLSRNGTKEAEQLGKLFDRCNLVQSTNDKMLSVYF